MMFEKGPEIGPEIVYLDTWVNLANYNVNLDRIEISSNMEPELLLFCLGHELAHADHRSMRFSLVRDLIMDLRDRWTLMTDDDLRAQFKEFRKRTRPRTRREAVEFLTYQFFSLWIEVLVIFVTGSRILLRRILD